MMTKSILFLLMGMFLLASCTPRVQVEAPEKPIVIDLNIKIQHEIRVKVEKDADDLLKKEKDLFE
jgi:uncharacterized lipoprotein YajG